MKSIESILENAQINRWAQSFLRAPYQIHKPHETDAELIQMKGNDSQLLAVSIDSVSEEITENIYRDPFTMGWVTVMSCFSDLAAVGADPLGMVLSISIESSRDDLFKERIVQGIESACRELSIFILGGDTNTTSTICLTGCALGLVPKIKVITRLGCQQGGMVFLSGRAGAGSALGLVRLMNLDESLFPETLYRPKARIQEGRMIREYATCCMDTSDGVLAALDQLMRLNQVGFSIDSMDFFLDAQVLSLSNITEIPSWLMLAGHHGEFELLFTIPQRRINSFLAAASRIGWTPVQIGRVIKDTEVKMQWEDQIVPIDTGKIRNLFFIYKDNVKDYFHELLKLANELGRSS